jgi:hypothetical protein
MTRIFCLSCLAMVLAACGGTAAGRVEPDPDPSQVGDVGADVEAAAPNDASSTPTPTPTTPTTPTSEPTRSPTEATSPRDPVVIDAFLDSEASWRFLESQITALRAEASALQTDILVKFRADSFEATIRDRKRTIWRLPKGLRLRPAGQQILLRRDHTCEVFGPDGLKIPMDGEISVIEGTISDSSQSVRKIRLMVKGGREFRSIKDAG